jgi:enamine deaminase RidA (YjgF/YER057c/UK114 family)
LKRKNIRPPGALDSEARGYTHVVAIEDPRKLIFVSGQGALDDQLKLIAPGDVVGQAYATLAKVRRALEAAGATPADVVKMVTFVTDATDQQPQVRQARIEFFDGNPPSASTMVEVAGLPVPGMLIEIEVIAAVGG